MTTTRAVNGRQDGALAAVACARALRWLALLVACFGSTAFADDTLVTFPSGTSSAPLPYVEYLPPGYSSSTTPERLLVFFHGVGESGPGTNATDVYNALTAHGPLKLIRLAGAGAHRFQGPQRAIVLAARNPSGLWSPTLASQFFGWVLQNYRVDTDAIYVTGLSAGGGPTWALQQDFPGKIAAVLPVCPVQQVWPVTSANAVDYRRIAVWAFHGYGDPTVPRDESIRWINAIGQALSRDPQFPSVMTGYVPGVDQTAVWTPAGFTWAPGIGSASPSPVRYTLLAVDSHFIWTDVYDSDAVWTWLFAQRRSQNVDPGASDAGVTDAGAPDAGGRQDAGSPDAGPGDAGVVSDAGPPEDGGLDAGSGEAVDAGAGVQPSPAEQACGGCAAVPAAPFLLLLGLLLRARRRQGARRR